MLLCIELKGENKFISKDLITDEKVQPIHSDVSFVNTSDELDVESFQKLESRI